MAEAPGADFNFQLYRYTPSLAAAVVGVVVFAILTIMHIGRLLKARAFYFTAFTIGGICKWPYSRLDCHSPAICHWTAKLGVVSVINKG